MIRWMLWGRQYGKTYQVIKWFLEDPYTRVIVTSNAVMAGNLRRQLQGKYPHGKFRLTTDAEAWDELLEKNVVAWSDATQHKLKERHVEVAVDNLDMILHTMCGGNEVRMVTATGVNESPVGLCVDPQMARYAQYIQDR